MGGRSRCPDCAGDQAAAGGIDWPAVAAAVRYQLEARPWPVGLEAQLARIDADAAPSWYRDEFDAGRLALLAVISASGDRAPLAWILTRIDDPEFVIVAAVSSAPDHALTRHVLPLLEARARQLKCSAVRMHTRRWGLVAVAGEAGYPVAEIVLRKVL